MKNDNRVRFTLRLPKDLSANLENEAIGLGISLNALILHMLWEAMEEKKSKHQDLL